MPSSVKRSACGPSTTRSDRLARRSRRAGTASARGAARRRREQSQRVALAQGPSLPARPGGRAGTSSASPARGERRCPRRRRRSRAPRPGPTPTRTTSPGRTGIEAHDGASLPFTVTGISAPVTAMVPAAATSKRGPITVHSRPAAPSGLPTRRLATMNDSRSMGPEGGMPERELTGRPRSWTVVCGPGSTTATAGVPALTRSGADTFARPRRRRWRRTRRGRRGESAPGPRRAAGSARAASGS